MKFIEPKRKIYTNVQWTISNRTKAIVEYYSKYTGYLEDEIVDDFLKNILEDAEFLKWIQKKRNNKRICSKLFDDIKVEANK